MRNPVRGIDRRSPLAKRRAVAGGGPPDWVSQVEGLRYGATVNGRTSTATLKVPGVDALPTGATWSAGAKTVTVTGTILSLSDWDFRNAMLQVNSGGFVGQVTQCLFGETAAQGIFHYVNVLAGGRIGRLDYCTFEGYGLYDGAGTFINSTVTGAGVSITVGRVDYILRCRFLRPAGDIIKSVGSPHWNGQRIEWCYFGAPANLPNAPTLWNNSTTYALGQCVSAPSGWLYVSRTSGNLNNALPPGVSKTEQNTHWQGIDPHSDALTMVSSLNRTSVRYCLFDWMTDPDGAFGPYLNIGLTNSLRLVRNVGADFVVGQFLTEFCVTRSGGDQVYPIQVVADQPNFNGPVIFRGLRGDLGTTAAYFHPTTDGLVSHWVDAARLNGTPIAAPTGAITADAAAAPVNTAAPALSGSPNPGVTVTAGVGTWTGWPTPFYTPTVQISNDGLSGWAVVSNDDAQYTIQAGDVGKFLRASVSAENSSGIVSANSGPVEIVAAAPTLVYVGGKTVNIGGGPGNFPLIVTLSGLTGGAGSAAAAGDFVIVAVGGSDAANRLPVFNTAGYTALGTLYVNNAQDVYLQVGYKVMPGTPDASVSISQTTYSSTGSVAVGVHVWRGVNLSTPMDVAAVSSTGFDTAAPDPAAITPATAGAEIVVIGCSASNSAHTLSSSLLNNVIATQRDQATFDVAMLVGSLSWGGGTVDPAAITASASATGNSAAAYTLALRPA